jgi:hypothetical protein
MGLEWRYPQYLRERNGPKQYRPVNPLLAKVSPDKSASRHQSSGDESEFQSTMGSLSGSILRRSYLVFFRRVVDLFFLSFFPRCSQ